MRKTDQIENIKLLKNKAGQLLKVRPRSINEIRIRLIRFLLKRKIEDGEKIVTAVIEELTDIGLLDDFEFAKWWIKQRIDFKPKGKILLRQELRKKGIADEVIQKAVSFYWEEEEEDIFGTKRAKIDDRQLAYKAIKNKLLKFSNLGKKDLPSLELRRVKEKMVRYLLRRGFEYEVARDVVDNCLVHKKNG